MTNSESKKSSQVNGEDKNIQIDEDKMCAMANAIRALSVDAVETAKSGHLGLPLGAADIATVLFSKFMVFDPTKPHWPNRDRFVLSAGHGSMLLYSLLYLLGYEDMTMEQIKNFRQLGSKAAGHPEFGEATGIETTTGPLGQGIATAVGMAMAERHLAAEFSDELFDHFTYVLAGDGDLMEGISHEAISLAAHLKLDRLIVLFDDNNVSIDGTLDISETGNQLKRFEAAGWHVQNIDGHDYTEIAKAISEAKKSNQPSMIACKTTIGFGAPNKAGTAGAHGGPYGAEEAEGIKKAIGWDAEPFEVPTEILDSWRMAGLRNARHRKSWEKKLDDIGNGTKSELERRLRGDLSADLERAIESHIDELLKSPKATATRKASGAVLEAVNPVAPETMGGSADLSGSVNTKTSDLGIFNAENYGGRYVYYGVREHGMAAAMNGLALHGGIIPYAGTFLVFSDYCRPAIRLSALMKQRVVYVMTHDSIGLGEDGPTHQPVEQLAALRAMPNLNVFRPADAVETAECWQLALESKSTPSVMVLTRQNIPQVRLEKKDQSQSARGGYILSAADGDARATLLATGSEVHLALEAQATLAEQDIAADVVSMPCWELFDKQSDCYKKSVLKPGTIKVAIEAGSSQGWDRYLGENGGVVALDTFGASAPYEDLFQHFGITSEALVAAVQDRLSVE